MVPSQRPAYRGEALQESLTRKAKGDLAELKVACDLIRRGYGIAIPYGEDSDFDLIVCREGILERVQVKHGASKEEVLVVKCRSYALTNGKVRSVKLYTSKTIDRIAIWDKTTDRCFYVPASELGSGRSMLHLRLTPARNGQHARTRNADDYCDLPGRPAVVEPAGFEPATSRMQTGRSPS
jgi:hypothetical protein